MVNRAPCQSFHSIGRTCPLCSTYYSPSFWLLCGCCFGWETHLPNFSQQSLADVQHTVCFYHPFIRWCVPAPKYSIKVIPSLIVLVLSDLHRSMYCPMRFLGHMSLNGYSPDLSLVLCHRLRQFAVTPPLVSVVREGPSVQVEFSFF